MSRLNDAAMLVSLNVSQWTARKFDRRVTQQVAQAHKTTESVGRYNKALLPEDKYLAKVHAITTSIRNNLYYKFTLPWGIEGSRLLPNTSLFEFSQEFHRMKSEWDAAVATFVSIYPQLKLQAKTDLANGLYNEADYPPVSAIRSKFRMDLAIFPVPSDDFRCKVSEGEMDALRKGVEEQLQRATNTAMLDVWQRLYDKVKHIAEKLADPANIFRDSMIENAKEICDLLPKLNLTGDPNLEAMRREVMSEITKHYPDTLRTDMAIRKTASDKAAEIMRKMEGYMGTLT